MAKWRITINNSMSFTGSQSSPATFGFDHVINGIIEDFYQKYSGPCQWDRALRVANLYALDDTLADDLDKNFVHHNGAGYWFIQIRPDVTMDDFEFVNLV